jgi:single-strand DNA-binding protein
MNQCTFTGRLTKDLELRHTTGDKPQAVLNFTLAVEKETKDASGNRQADFFNFVAWGKPAENMVKNLAKGDSLLVTGRAQNRSYQKDGHTVYVTEYVVKDFPEFLRVKKWENGGSNTNSNGNANAGSQQNGNPYDENAPYTEVSDDDLPF